MTETSGTPVAKNGGHISSNGGAQPDLAPTELPVLTR